MSLSQNGLPVGHAVVRLLVHSTHAPVVASQAGVVGSFAAHDPFESQAWHVPDTHSGVGLGQSALEAHWTQTSLTQKGLGAVQLPETDVHSTQTPPMVRSQNVLPGTAAQSALEAQPGEQRLLMQNGVATGFGQSAGVTHWTHW